MVRTVGTRRDRVLLVVLAALAVLVLQSGRVLDVQLVLDAGPADRGVNVGTLFEADNGDVVCRAGVQAAAQSRGTLASRTLEFTCGPREPDLADFKVVSVPRPAPGVYRSEIRSVAGRVFEAQSRTFLVNRQWRPMDAATRALISGEHDNLLGTVQRIGTHTLAFPHSQGEVLLDGQPVLRYAGSLRSGVYYAGRVFIAWADAGRPAAGITSCALDLQRGQCDALRTFSWPYEQDVYGMLGWRGDVYFAAGGNAQGLDAGVWRVPAGTDGRMQRALPAEGQPAVGGEFYGMLVMNDTLVAGHYPTGYLGRVHADGSSELLQVPAPLPDTWGSRADQPLYREAQTLSLYAGRLWVGMYPWGFLWVADPELARWHRARLFDWPAVDPAEPAPFHTRMEQLWRAAARTGATLPDPKWLQPSLWGQRIHSAALSASEDGVAFGLGNMPGLPWDPARDARFGDESRFAAYGATRIVKAPATIIERLALPAGRPIALGFEVRRGEMRLTIDGQLRAALPTTLTAMALRGLEVRRIGEGLYGRSEIAVQRR